MKKILQFIILVLGISVFQSQVTLNTEVTEQNKVVTAPSNIKFLPGFVVKAASVGTFNAYISYSPDVPTIDTNPSTGMNANENYIFTTQCLDSDCTKKAETVQYFDGLGRPKQVVGIKASPLGRDVVTHIEYDGFGRQVKDFLPVPQSGTGNGAIVNNPLGNAASIYGGEKVYAEKVFENSPLDRIQQQLHVGNDWSNKPVKFDYDANAAGEVKKYTTTTTWENNATRSSINYSGSYGAAQLYKNTITDEDGKKTIEFKNGQGQTLLVRKENGSENVDTYYVYNEYDQLAWVIPPLLSKMQTWGISEQNALAYEYRYDGRNRLVEKKLPGKGWEYMVYDKQDRLALTQDAHLRDKGQWMFTKYDQFSRPIYTGILDSFAGRIQQAGAVESFGSANEAGVTSSWNNSGMDIYYTKNRAYPDSNVKVLTVNYYDSYLTGDPFPTMVFSQQVLPSDVQQYGVSTKGLTVSKMVKNIEDDNWTKTYFYYDLKGRPIREYSLNHLGGYTNVERKLDFSGNPKIVLTRHKRRATDTERTVTENFTYDHQNRLLVHTHKVDSKPVEILAQNKYNELSQLENKKVGGINPSSPLQSIDYGYNIRGWMTKINDPGNLNGKLFGYSIRYNNPLNPVSAPGRYNGNITETDWKTSNDQVLKRYSYSYDGLNRLEYGNYSEPLTTKPTENYYGEYLQYDLNGNINFLARYSKNNNGQTTLTDALHYTYQGNRLQKIVDGSNNPDGYPGGGNVIAYDDNGNMKEMLDKGISNIQYNFLNLPKQITQGSAIMKYNYRADGVKIKKLFGDRATDYLDGFQYSDNSPHGFGLDFYPTTEGYFDFRKNKYIYNYVDHLGNVRLSYQDNSSGVEIIEENNYYPFGLRHKGYNTQNGNASYQYKYQGQELQETGFYSFKWRNYMPDVGRFFNIDPLAESFPYNSTYAFSENRVIDGIELEGLEVVLLKDIKKNEPIINTATNGLYKDNPNTKTVHVFAHGNPKEFYNENGKKGETTINSGKGLNNVLNEGSSLWRNSGNHDGFTVVLHSCRTGRYTLDKEGNVIDPVASIISESKEMKGVNIIGPDERDFVSAKGNEIGPQVAKKTDHNGDYLPGTPRSEHGKPTGEYGSWNTFNNGQRVDKQPGMIKPEGKDQRSLWDRIFN